MRLAELFPEYSDKLLAICDKSADLLHLLRNNKGMYEGMENADVFNYYHKDLSGSYSIKKTLPTLVPSLTYKGMDVGNGVEYHVDDQHVKKSCSDDPQTQLSSLDPKQPARGLVRVHIAPSSVQDQTVDHSLEHSYQGIQRQECTGRMNEEPQHIADTSRDYSDCRPKQHTYSRKRDEREIDLAERQINRECFDDHAQRDKHRADHIQMY